MVPTELLWSYKRWILRDGRKQSKLPKIVIDKFWHVPGFVIFSDLLLHQIYSAKMEIHAQLSGLRHIMCAKITFSELILDHCVEHCIWQSLPIKGTTTLGSPPWQESWPTSRPWRYDPSHMIILWWWYSYYDDMIIERWSFSSRGSNSPQPEPKRPN